MSLNEILELVSIGYSMNILLSFFWIVILKTFEVNYKWLNRSLAILFLVPFGLVLAVVLSIIIFIIYTLFRMLIKGNL